MWNLRRNALSKTIEPMITGPKNAHEKQLAIIAAIVIIGVLIFTVVVNPQLKERQLRIERKQKLLLTLAKMEGDLLIKDRIDNAYLQIEPLISGSSNDQQEISFFTRELNDLYSKLDVKIRSLIISPVAKEDSYKRLAIKIEMSGHMRNILNFIVAVETYSKPLRIEQFDLKAQETTDNIQVSFVISKIVSESKNIG